jgi:hypothetical protein
MSVLVVVVYNIIIVHEISNENKNTNNAAKKERQTEELRNKIIEEIHFETHFL